MIEAIIGRQHGTNCLLMNIQGKGYPISDNGTVPNTVSSSHCKLTVDDDGTWKLSNIKSELDTFVDGLQIDAKRITPRSRVELGINHFVVDMHKVEAIIKQLQPSVFSLLPLKQIWKDYDEEKLQLQKTEAIKANYQRLGSILSMSGIAVGCIPNEYLPSAMVEYVIPFRVVTIFGALLIGLYFLYRGSQASNSLPMKIKKLNDDFEKKYVCPNPDCPRFMGYRPYNQLQYDKGCPHCQCKYTNT